MELFLVIILSLAGIKKLEVENSFINYFDKETEIYKGMKIDDDLGGTTPLNIIIKFPTKKKEDNSDDDFAEWDEDNEKDEDKSNTGLQEIKWTKF